MDLTLKAAVAAVLAGRCLVYPTETLYALGCDAGNEQAVSRIFSLKGRDPDKPLPLILGRADMLPLVATAPQAAVLDLAARFWPGPLTLVLPALPGLPRGVVDGRGRVAVRVTPHPLAARLSGLAGRPLVATSANLSGDPAPARPERVAEELAALGLVAGEPWPAGGPPSTIVEPTGPDTLVIHREGAVSALALGASLAGWRLVAATGEPAG